MNITTVTQHTGQARNHAVGGQGPSEGPHSRVFFVGRGKQGLHSLSNLEAGPDPNGAWPSS
jgi:hypothetical protein